MSSARDVILERIRVALEARESLPSDNAGVGQGATTEPVPRAYRRRGSRDQNELLDLLHDRIVDYEASVVRCPPARVPETISRALEVQGVLRLAVPPDIPESWLGEASRKGFEVIRDHDSQTLSTAQLNSAHGVLTGCALAIAETGTLVLDGGVGQGRRALTLLPDYHLCVVFQSQVVETVPEAVEAVGETVREQRWPITLISGPSATSDIELIRVEGVHGPRTLDVILVEDS